MDLGLEGRRALVTAASKGLGRACAAALAAEGARVYIAARGQEDLERTAKEINAAGFQAADVSQPDVPGRLVEDAVKALGGLDILVCNAGGPPAGTFDSTPLEEWEKGFNLTLMSTVRLCKAAIPHLRQSDQGRIVVVTSTSVREPIPTLVLSSAFRTAVVQTLKTLSNELAAQRITVNNVAPGRFLTDRVRQLDGAAAQKEGISQEEYTERSVKASIPMGRIGDPAEFGAVCAFVCSRHAGFLTGQTIMVDGGQTHGVY
ncbi:MAG TPA: SDR family oxidoreductase [Candidatus Dormibacteraeota bacterium]